MIFLEIVLFFIIALGVGELFKLIKLPKLLGYLLVGIAVGAIYQQLDWSMYILEYKTSITKIALAVILLKAGLGISKTTLKKVGFRSGLLGVIPNVLEATAIAFVSYLLIDSMTIVDGFLLGFIVSAVSPAVVIPSMTKIQDEGYGRKSGIPTMNLASASIDDVISLTMFAIFLNISQSDSGIVGILIKEPLIFINGIIIGIILAKLFSLIFYNNKNIYAQILQFLSVFIVMGLITINGHSIYVNSTICIMVFGFLFKEVRPGVSEYFKKYTNIIWSVLVVFLFFLIGAQVQVDKALDIGFIAIVIIIIGLSFRLVSSYLCLYKSSFTKEQKLFNSIANIPKATVQATIGAVPLANGISSGNIILSIAVMSILITAPSGLILIESNYKKLLRRD